MKTVRWSLRAGLALCMAALLCLLGLPAGAAEPVYLDSGSKDMEKLTKREIADLLEKEDVPGDIYVEEPSTTAPYRPGQVKTEVLQAAADRLSALRRLAGLPPVELDLAESQECQYGAVLLAASEFSHFPSQPADMDDDFYLRGHAVTTSSNLSLGTALRSVPDALMMDTGENNLSTVGHRRWQLNPTLGKVGFGTAEISFFGMLGGIPVTAESVFDNSGPGCDYDFIAWPPSGYFPLDQFSVYMPWSVTVDTEKYGAPSLEKVSVRLTRESDGKTWEFYNDPSQTTVTLNGQYFNVDLGGYGEPNAIIFRPGGHEAWHGLYTVEIFGLDEPLAYQVNLFHLVNADKPDPSRYFVDVESNDWFLAEAEYAYEHGIMTGVGGGRFAPYDPVDRATAVQILYNLEGRPALPDDLGTPYGDVDPDVWYTDAVYWARSVQVAEGDGENFRPLDPISREEFAAMLYRYAGYKGYSLSGAGDLGRYSDGDRVSGWAVESLAWANGNGLIKGHDNGTIGPQGTTERAQAAAVLMRFCQQFVE